MPGFMIGMVVLQTSVEFHFNLRCTALPDVQKTPHSSEKTECLQITDENCVLKVIHSTPALLVHSSMYLFVSIRVSLPMCLDSVSHNCKYLTLFSHILSCVLKLHGWI